MGLWSRADHPPHAVKAESLACVYAVSVFTHLSKWRIRRGSITCSRSCSRGGLLIISTHGDATRDRLVRTEAQAYDRGDLVVRDRVLKDSRTFLAYQSPQFVRRTLLREFEVLGHDQSPASILYPQDLWVTRKPAPGAANSRP